MSHYTTGEIAKQCGVSVRTVQFYDTKGLLKPSSLTDGGRRLYSEDDVNQLRLICLLKSLSLSLESIKDILASEAPAKVLLLLLDAQTKQIGSEIEEKQKQLQSIRAIKESICNNRAIPVKSIADIEQMMKSKKSLRKTHFALLAVGLVMDAIEVVALVYAIEKGFWWPFIIGLPSVILLGILAIGMYHRNVAFICPECNTTFKPKLMRFIFSNHTPKTRKLTCPNGHTGYCVEVSSSEVSLS